MWLRFMTWLFLCWLIGCLSLGTLLWNKPALLEKIVISEKNLQEADALVLMAGSRSKRLPAIVELYNAGVAPRVLLTNDGTLGRWSEKHQRNLYHVEWAREYLLEWGIPAEVIEILDFMDSGTYYDAVNTRDFVDRDDSIRSLLVVSSNYHTRRTLWTFQQVFSETDVKIGVYPIPKAPDDERRWLIRNGVETFKLGFYWLWYGMLQELGTGTVRGE